MTSDDDELLAEMRTSHDDGLLAEVRAATEAIAAQQDRQLAAVRAARAARVPVEQIARAAGLTRDGLYKLLQRRAA